MTPFMILSVFAIIGFTPVFVYEMRKDWWKNETTGDETTGDPFLVACKTVFMVVCEALILLNGLYELWRIWPWVPAVFVLACLAVAMFALLVHYARRIYWKASIKTQWSKLPPAAGAAVLFATSVTAILLKLMGNL